MLDMYDCSPEVLNDPGLVTNILQTLPEQLGMRILMGPFVSFAQPNGKRDPGDGQALLSSKIAYFEYTVETRGTKYPQEDID